MRSAGETHLCPPHHLDILSDPDDQDELFPDRVLVVVVRHLGVRKRSTLGLEVASEVCEVSSAGFGQGELVGLVALYVRLVLGLPGVGGGNGRGREGVHSARSVRTQRIRTSEDPASAARDDAANDIGVRRWRGEAMVSENI